MLGGTVEVVVLGGAGWCWGGSGAGEIVVLGWYWVDSGTEEIVVLGR